jgi:hypothetical protein
MKARTKLAARVGHVSYSNVGPPTHIAFALGEFVEAMIIVGRLQIVAVDVLRKREGHPVPPVRAARCKDVRGNLFGELVWLVEKAAPSPSVDEVVERKSAGHVRHCILRVTAQSIGHPPFYA